MRMRSQARERKLGIWVFSDCEGCIQQVQEINSAIRYPIAREVHYDGSNEPVGAGYQLSIIVGPVRRGIDLGQISLIRRRSLYVITVSACATAIGREYFAGQAAMKYETPGHFSDTVAPEFQLRAPASDYIETDYDVSGYSLNSPILKEVVGACLEGRANRLEAENSDFAYPGITQDVEKIVSFPQRRIVSNLEKEPSMRDLKCESDQQMQNVVYAERDLLRQGNDAHRRVTGATLAAKRFYRDFISRVQ
jgi:coenzyme F420-reducing hydrogenase gamma subunit